MATRRLASMLLCCMLAAPAATAAQDRYVDASVGDDGRLEIVRVRGRPIHIVKPKGVEGWDQIRISADRLHVGWLEQEAFCCTSYPIALKLVIYTNGRRQELTGNKLAIFRWQFVDDGVRVAFYQDTLHGQPRRHYELRETDTGRLIEVFEPPLDADGDEVKDARRPAWVMALEKDL